MTGFKPRTSRYRSDWCANWATTTDTTIFNLTFVKQVVSNMSILKLINEIIIINCVLILIYDLRNRIKCCNEWLIRAKLGLFFVYFLPFHNAKTTIPSIKVDYKWKKKWWCAWDSNSQDGRRRRIRLAPNSLYQSLIYVSLIS